MTGEPAMPDTTATNQSPNEKLAKQIADALAGAGVIKDNHKSELLAKLKAGGVRHEDWGLWIDMATAPETGPQEAGDE
jgi:hypothetical protein